MGFAESSNAEGNVQTSSESVSHTQEAAVLHSSTEEVKCFFLCPFHPKSVMLTFSLWGVHFSWYLYVSVCVVVWTQFLEMEHAAVTSPAGDGKQTTDEDDFMSWFPEEGVDGVKDVTLTEEDLLLIDDVLKNL